MSHLYVLLADIYILFNSSAYLFIELYLNCNVKHGLSLLLQLVFFHLYQLLMLLFLTSSLVSMIRYWTSPYRRSFYSSSYNMHLLFCLCFIYFTVIAQSLVCCIYAIYFNWINIFGLKFRDEVQQYRSVGLNQG